MSEITIDPRPGGEKISPEIYGHFIEHLGRCIDNGLYVGEDSPIPNTDGIRNDVLQALREVKVPVLRWPGGCFAEEYHWMDGVGPRDQRKKMVNSNWGSVIERNRFGTHEFMRLCELLDCEPCLCGNVGSGTVREMQEWVEYITFDGESPMAELRRKNGREKPWKLKYFGVGNENWGCGGCMRPEYYADVYRQYQTYLRNYGENRLFKIAGGPNGDNYHWTRELMKSAGKYTDAISMHYYTRPLDTWGGTRGSATEFDEASWYKTLYKSLKIEEILLQHFLIMDEYDPERRVKMVSDEWGGWYDAEPGTNPAFLFQQNTMRDALIAGINLNLFNKHCDRICMTNIAQMVNVVQALILTEGEKMILTPTYHVFRMYREHQGASLLSVRTATPAAGPAVTPVPRVQCSASLGSSGTILLTVCNLSVHTADPLCIRLQEAAVASAEGAILKGQMTEHNTFEEPEQLTVQPFEDFSIKDGAVSVSLPPCCVASFKLVPR